MRACVCHVNCATRDEALRLGHALVEERLAASANVLGEVVSIYRWAGELHEKPEVALSLKTTQALAQRLMARLRELHSYECPSIVLVAVEAGDADYLAWLEAETG